MEMVWRHNGNGFDAVGPSALFSRHGGKVFVCTIFGDSEFSGGFFGSGRIATEGTCQQFITIVQARGHAMHIADKSAYSATHHT
jgi:hypothetical protein